MAINKRIAIPALSLLFSCISLIQVNPSRANEQDRIRTAPSIELMKISTDAAPGENQIRIALGPEGELLGMVYNTPNGEQVFTLKRLRAGVTLKKISIKTVAALKTPNLNPNHGGIIELSLLRQYFVWESDDVRLINLELTRENGTWHVRTNGKNGRQDFNKVFLVARRNESGKAQGVNTVIFKENGRTVDSVNTEDLPTR